MKNNLGRSSASANAILSSLPHDQFELLSPYMTRETFDQGVVLVEAGDEIDFVYFPHKGVVSLLSVLKTVVPLRSQRSDKTESSAR